MQKTFICNTEEQTAALAEKLALKASRGDVFALFGTLGMGKSVFARAFIQKLCGKEEVPSPTFTLVQTYEAPYFDIYHFDLYRLESPDEIVELGFEEAVYDGVCLIEWPEKAGHWLPPKAFKINIVSEGSGRKITIDVPDSKIKMLEML